MATNQPERRTLPIHVRILRLISWRIEPRLIASDKAEPCRKVSLHVKEKVMKVIGLQIRTATLDDRPRLIPLINAAFSIETFLEGTRTDESGLAEMMRTGEVLVGEDMAGRLLCAVYTELHGNRGYLGMLAVDPAHQGTGLARRIAAAAEDRFRASGCDAVDITVLNLRPELPRIYRRFGYAEVGVEECKITQPLRAGGQCHSIHMTKRL
jgi:ribosomal protein S18 acetylase RimI-like enzyme